MSLPITVNELRTGHPRRLGDNTILIAVTRHDVGFIRNVLIEYVETGSAKRTKEICAKFVQEMDERIDW